MALLALGLSGCAIVKSHSGVHGAEGVGYMLPRALLPVELKFDGVGFDLTVKSPVGIGDPNHVYALRRTGSIFSHDNVTISVDATTGLLTGVDVKSDDKSAQALKTLVTGTSTKKAEDGKAGAAAQVLFDEHFDPGWPTDQVQAFNQRLQAAAHAAVVSLQVAQGCATVPASDAACKAAARLVEGMEKHPLVLAVDGAELANRQPADCGAGFCYRINVPHVVRISGAGFSRSQHFGLPNRSPTFVMPLERWAFVRTTHDVKLQGGVVTSVTTDRPSSALAVAAVPFDIAKAAVSSMSELVQLKIDLSGKEAKLAKDQVTELEAKLKLKEAEDAAMKAGAAAAPGKAESAVLGDKGLNLRIGPTADALSNLKADKENPLEMKAAGGGGSTSAASGGQLGAGGKK